VTKFGNLFGDATSLDLSNLISWDVSSVNSWSSPFPQYDDPCTFRVLVDNWPANSVSKFFGFLGYAAAMCDSSSSNQPTNSSSSSSSSNPTTSSSSTDNNDDTISTISIILSSICLLFTVVLGFGHASHREIIKRMSSSKVHATDQSL